MIDALRRSAGNITVACKNVGVSRDTHYRWLHDDDWYNDECSKVDEETGDMVEGELMKHIRSGNLTAIIFYCKTKLKDRGYVEKNEMDLGGDMTINVTDFE